MTKAPGRPFKPGQSGNPAGRKPGTSSTTKLRAGIAEHVPAIIEALLTQAKAGDAQAARLLLERTLPALKPEERPVPVDMPLTGTLTDKGAAVLEATAAGVLSASQGAALLASLGTMAKLVETDELTRRIAALEARQGKPGEKP